MQYFFLEQIIFLLLLCPAPVKQYFFSTYLIFLLFSCCSNIIEVAYQEAVALRRQEELIREEEAAVLAESGLKAKRGVAEKDKQSKKKQVCIFI